MAKIACSTQRGNSRTYAPLDNTKRRLSSPVAKSSGHFTFRFLSIACDFLWQGTCISWGVSDLVLTPYAVDTQYSVDQPLAPAAARLEDRRGHPRLKYSEVSAPVARILSRPRVWLVNVSPGGVLVDAPFQLRPGSQLVLEVSTDEDAVTVRNDTVRIPFHVLRCYVSDLKDGVRYHAAGTFKDALTSQNVPFGPLRATEWHRLLRILESFR